MTVNSEFTARLVAGQKMHGMFVKTPHPVMIEILSRSGLSIMGNDASAC
ncbi:hypothetical protein [Meridianimarinicoccus sp. MJW13]|nr:hypothetical protein [Fluviibacterium sp. MJW13]